MAPSESVQSDPAKPWKCPTSGCDSEYKTEKSLKIHSLKHLEDPKEQKPYACEFENCEYRAAQLRGLRHHVQAKHTKDPRRARKFQCPTCPARFFTKSVLSVHLRTHDPAGKAFKCGHCDYKSNQRGTLNIHVKALHEKSIKLYCSFPECSYSTPWSSSLRLHSQTHEPDRDLRRRYSCNFQDCDYRAFNKTNLDLHVTRRHAPSRSKDINCPMCEKKFYEQQGMKVHIRLVHAKEKNHTCSTCGFKAFNLCTLKLHRMAIHKEGPAREKNFKCDLCDFRTYKRTPLRLHKMTVHSEERRFKCGYVACYYKTNSCHSYRRHMLIHEQGLERQYPLECNFPTCDFRRKEKREIEKHRELHKTSEFLFSCQKCPNTYPDKVSLTFHEWMKHAKTSFACSVCEFTAPLKCAAVQHYRQCHDPNGNQKKPLGPPSTSCKKSKAGRSSGRNLMRIVPLECVTKRSNSKFEGRDEHSVLQRHNLQRAPVVLLNKIQLKIV